MELEHSQKWEQRFKAEVQSTVGEFREQKSVTTCTGMQYSSAMCVADGRRVGTDLQLDLRIDVLDRENIQRHSAVMAAQVLVLIVAALQLRASVGVAYTPSHGWDVYYDWALPSDTKAAALWTVDMNFTVTTDPGKTTFYYWSHYTLWVPSVVGSVSHAAGWAL